MASSAGRRTSQRWVEETCSVPNRSARKDLTRMSILRAGHQSVYSQSTLLRRVHLVSYKTSPEEDSACWGLIVRMEEEEKLCQEDPGVSGKEELAARVLKKRADRQYERSELRGRRWPRPADGIRSSGGITVQAERAQQHVDGNPKRIDESLDRRPVAVLVPSPAPHPVVDRDRHLVLVGSARLDGGRLDDANFAVKTRR